MDVSRRGQILDPVQFYVLRGIECLQLNTINRAAGNAFR